MASSLKIVSERVGAVELNICSRENLFNKVHFDLFETKTRPLRIRIRVDQKLILDDQEKHSNI